MSNDNNSDNRIVVDEKVYTTGNPEQQRKTVPKIGPNPTLLSRKEVDALYETFYAIIQALQELQIDYIVTGGTLLGAIRQHSILFCDDDIDIAIIEDEDGGTSKYDCVVQNLQNLIGTETFIYQIKPWEGGDKIRHKRFNNVFIDLFVLRRYNTQQELMNVLRVKKNGTYHNQHYIDDIINSIEAAAFSQKEQMELYPCYQFNTRKAMEMWPKEVYRLTELFPLQRNLKFGPYTNIQGPAMPILLLKRAFGSDCFHVYYQSYSHQQPRSNHNQQQTSTGNGKRNERTSQKEELGQTKIQSPRKIHNQSNKYDPHSTFIVDNSSSSFDNRIEHDQDRNDNGGSTTTTTTRTLTVTSNENNSNSSKEKKKELSPFILPGGTWEGGTKLSLEAEHYLPMQPTSRFARRPTLHNQQRFFEYLQKQSELEQRSINNYQNNWYKLEEETTQKKHYPRFFIHDDCEKHVKVQQKQPERQAQLQSLKSNTMTKDKCKSPAMTHRPNRTVYMDGVFDLFHVGHLEAIRQCSELGNRVIIGVTGDKDASGYKRPPIIGQRDRVALVDSIRYVNKVICPCPLIVTDSFMKEHSIDLVVHGFASDEDYERQKEFFQVPMNTGRFIKIAYYSHLSTTDIIQKIRKSGRPDAERSSTTSETDKPKHSNPARDKSHKLNKWFGRAVAEATHNQSKISYDPISVELRHVMEPHICKARAQRKKALDVIQARMEDPMILDYLLLPFRTIGLGQMEGLFSFDTVVHDLRSAFLFATGQENSFDLTQIHNSTVGNFKGTTQTQTKVCKKYIIMRNLTNNFLSFQEVYDDFVRKVCAPRMESIMDLRGNDECNTIYYQSFPCIRVIQPNEFSIGPHADVAYGHHPFSINFYVPLTPTKGTSSLFIESRPGSEDWHPIEGCYGVIKHFAGALCAHWTTENKTNLTRVSLDFRLIDGRYYDKMKSIVSPDTDSHMRSNLHWFYDGYYSVCRKAIVQKQNSIQSISNAGKLETKLWQRDGPLLPPDARMGFPWTVKDWKRFSQKDSSVKTLNNFLSI